MNSVANGKVLRQSPYKRLYVQSAAGDAGGADRCRNLRLASALRAQAREPRVSPLALAGDALERRAIMEHAYLGPAARDEEIAALLSAHAGELDRSGCRVERIDDQEELCRRTADASPTGAWWAGSRVAWNGARARSATAPSSAIRAAPT